MPHIALPEDLPGIGAGFAFRPETAKPMRDLAHVLLHESNSLTPGERELIATYVSSQNDCHFCQTSHGAAAAAHLGSSEIVKQVKADFESAPVTPKLKARWRLPEGCSWEASGFMPRTLPGPESRARPTKKFTIRY